MTDEELKARLQSKATESWARIKKHMPVTKDLTLIILKGHLLVEHELNDFIEINLRDPKALMNARLTLSQRLAIVKAICGFDGTFPYKQVERLNVLRNELVHNLEPKYLEKLANSFVQDLEHNGFESSPSDKELSSRLRSSIIFLCGEIFGYKEGRMEGCKNWECDALPLNALP